MVRRTDVQLKPDPRLSAIHAAYVVAIGVPCNDERTEKALVRGASELNTRLLSASMDVARFWHHLAAAVARNEPEQQACESALLAAGCSELQVEQTGRGIARLLHDCVLAFKNRYPKLSDQLELRGKPLQAKWDTFGPGLLNQIAHQIWASDPPAEWWPPKVVGSLIQPLRGGDGGFDVVSGRFWIEAMLTDAQPNVPEVLRVAWLITQIAVAKHAGNASDGAEESLPWKLGTVPIVLSAGAELEMIHGPLPIETACHLWHLGGAETAQVVTDWWLQWQETRAPMPVALKALDKMLQPLQKLRLDGTLPLDECDDELFE